MFSFGEQYDWRRRRHTNLEWKGNIMSEWLDHVSEKGKYWIYYIDDKIVSEYPMYHYKQDRSDSVMFYPAEKQPAPPDLWKDEYKQIDPSVWRRVVRGREIIIFLTYGDYWNVHIYEGKNCVKDLNYPQVLNWVKRETDRIECEFAGPFILQ